MANPDLESEISEKAGLSQPIENMTSGPNRFQGVSKLRLLIIGVVAVCLLAGGLIFWLGRKEGVVKKEPVTLEFWGVFDDSDAYQSAIASFQSQKQYSHIKINYRKLTYEEYEKTLIDAMAAGRSPDIFAIHHTWLAKHSDKIYPLPPAYLGLKDFKETFPEVAHEDLVKDEKIYGLPLSINTLGLYYNKDLFNQAGIISPPATWQEFMDDVRLLTKRNEKGDIVRAGAALGTAKNINRSTDILSLLMLQSGTKMIDEKHTKATFNQRVLIGEENYDAGEKALQFYTDFASPLKTIYTWNNKVHDSITAFTEGEAAMMLNYSYLGGRLKAKAPYLNFGVAKVPQIADSDMDVNYANYWALTVSKNSRYKMEAWAFLMNLSQKEVVATYLNKTQNPPARKDLVTYLKEDEILGPFAGQTLTAKSWYQPDELAVETILADMIESVVAGRSTYKQAIELAADQITVLMK